MSDSLSSPRSRDSALFRIVAQIRRLHLILHRLVGDIDASLALEMLSFTGPEVGEGLASHLEKRRPAFPPDSPL